MAYAAVIYIAGVVIALLRTDAGLGTRFALALAWPIGPLAFVATVAMLVTVAAIANPLFGVLLAGAAAGWWALKG